MAGNSRAPRRRPQGRLQEGRQRGDGRQEPPVPRGPGPDAQGGGPRVPPRGQGEGAAERRAVAGTRGTSGRSRRRRAAAPPAPRAVARARRTRSSPAATRWSRRCARASRCRRVYIASRLEVDDRMQRDHRVAGEREIPAARGQPRRARPAHRRCGAPGRRPQGAAVRVRATPTTCSTRAAAARPGAADRRPRRRDRPAQPRRGRAVGGGVRRARRASCRSGASAGDDGVGVEDVRGCRRARPGRAGDEPGRDAARGFRRRACSSSGWTADGDISLPDLRRRPTRWCSSSAPRARACRGWSREQCDAIVSIPIASADRVAQRGRRRGHRPVRGAPASAAL